MEEDVDSQVNFVRQSLLAGPQLTAHRASGGSPSPLPDRSAITGAVAWWHGQPIKIAVHSAHGRDEDLRTAGSIYRIVYLDRNRSRAVRVVQTLLDTFVNETLGGKREGS